jgi:hypothetical protein
VRALSFDVDLDAPTAGSARGEVHGGGQPFVSACFSGEGDTVACVTGAPESRLVAWHWQRNRVAFSNRRLELPPDAPVAAPAAAEHDALGGTPPPPPLCVQRITFHPTDPTVLATSGPTHLRLWKVAPFAAAAASAGAKGRGLPIGAAAGGEDELVATAAAAKAGEGRGPKQLHAMAAVRHLPGREEGEEYTDHTWTVRVRPTPPHTRIK